MDTRNIGLRNIEVADTKICSIDGENGKLIYRGYDILDLANHSTYEETAFLLLFGELPSLEELNLLVRILWIYYNLQCWNLQIMIVTEWMKEKKIIWLELYP